MPQPTRTRRGTIRSLPATLRVPAPVRLTCWGAVELLRDAASELDAVLERRADELAERLSEGDFRVAVCGGFSNGKSSLINALIGEDLLPVGVLPVTSIATEVRHGTTAARIELDDGTRRPVAVTELAAWMSEANNPDNAKGVARVLVETPAPLLEPGVTLVDTPGLESIFEHNDTTAMATIRDAEGALVVLSADAPLTAAERRLLDVVAERASATFFSLNRADHLSTAETDQAVSFVSDAVEAATGSAHQVFATSARRAIEARSSGDPAARDAGTDALHEALTNFVGRELVEVRQQAFALALRRLADELADADALTTVTAGLAADELADRVDHFERAAETERTRLGEDTVLLATSVKSIADDLADWLARQGSAPVSDAAKRFAAVAQQTPLRRLEQALDWQPGASTRCDPKPSHVSKRRGASHRPSSPDGSRPAPMRSGRSPKRPSGLAWRRSPFPPSPTSPTGFGTCSFDRSCPTLRCGVRFDCCYLTRGCGGA
jgi:GTP-binding protein EngB required for normal cell division